MPKTPGKHVDWLRDICFIVACVSAEPLPSVMAHPPQRKRGWWREFFEDHPGLAAKTAESYTNPTLARPDKQKVWCKQCFARRIAEEQAHDEKEVAVGQRGSVRDGSTIRQTCAFFPPTHHDAESDIHHKVWAMGQHEPNRGWQSNAQDTLLNHLKTCPHQLDSVRHDAKDWKSRGSPLRRTHQEAFGDSNMLPLPGMSQFAVAGPSSIPILQPIPTHLQTSALFSPSASNSPAMSPLLLDSPSLPSAVPSPTPSDSSFADSQKRRRLSRSASSHTLSRHATALEPWNPGKQERFESRIARITAAANFPLAWIENPEVLAFFDEFIPGAKVPTRKVLTNRIIPAEVDKLRRQAMKNVSGSEVTIQCDGWTALNTHHYIAFMMTTSTRQESLVIDLFPPFAHVILQVYTIQVHDASSEGKTAENLLALILMVKNTVEKDWGVTVVAVTSDASGESSKARRLTVKSHRELVVPDCYGHQVTFCEM